MTERPGISLKSGLAKGALKAVGRRGFLRHIRHITKAGGQHLAGSLVRRVVVVNLAGLAALLGAILYINQTREGLIDARIGGLFTQGEIIAAAIAASATVETDTIWIEPDKLLMLQSGQTLVPSDSDTAFSINPVEVAPLLRKLVSPTQTRARIFDQEGELLLDTAAMYSRGDILKFELPPPNERNETFFKRVWNTVALFINGDHASTEDDGGKDDGRNNPEVRRAFEGAASRAVSFNRAGQTIVSVAVPVQRSRMVKGVLLLSTFGGDIDNVIRAERLTILRIFGIAAGILVIVSALFAGTIVGPIRRLSAAADRVRRGVKTREEIPDFSARADEIGDLSRSLREMTRVLYDRIEAIESFAADVAHELKNPLTSLRSAVETWPLARTDEARGRLVDVIQHDVRRLDRLISDISNASRLDAEMARVDVSRVDMVKLCETIIDIANGMSSNEQVRTRFVTEISSQNRKSYFVMGQDARLGQVLTNLIVNAKSFSKNQGEVRVAIMRIDAHIEIHVEDDGPGIPDHALEKIFQRFYTDRPDQGFGQNSGLGLSISRQIVLAHRGTIWAENRYSIGVRTDDMRPIGAKFVVRLPAVS